MLKTFIRKHFYYFTYFYQYLRGRMFVAFGLSMGVALLDGFGLAMFLPLLQMIDGGEGNSNGLGKLDFIIRGMEDMGIPLTVPSVLLVMVFFFILKGIFKFGEGYYRMLTQRFFIQKLRFMNVDLLVNFSYKSFVLSDSGKIQNTVSGEIERLLIAFASYFYAMQAAAMVLVYLILALSVNAQFSLLVVVGGLLTNLVYSGIYKNTKEHSRKLTGKNHVFQGLLIQKVAFFKYLKATGLLPKYGEKLKSNILDIEQSQKKLGVLGAITTALKEPLIVVVVVTVILIEILWLGGSLSLIVLSLLFFYRALTSTMHLQTYWNELLTYQGSLENMSSFLSELRAGSEIQGKRITEEFKREILLDKVSFGYGDKKVLKGISFSIPKNQTLALVGESGSGKTSLINLLAGLSLPDKGDIYFDGLSIRDMDRNSLQQRIGYITQEPVIFNGSIFNNVSFWDTDSPENRQKCRVALQKAAVYDFVSGLKQGLDAPLGNNGVLVSGGQKQRISIARELYKDIDILLMDEATSSLDSETERAIQENIDALKGQYTIIIIAHRLSTVRNADRIILLKNGKVEQSGSFDELMDHSISFKKMVELQDF